MGSFFVTLWYNPANELLSKSIIIRSEPNSLLDQLIPTN